VSIIVSSLPLITVLACILTVILVFAIRQRFSFRCSEEWEEELDGIKYVVCGNRDVNAWYDWSNKRIYISRPLKEALSREELKAVIYHELGHAKHSRLVWLRQIIDSYWIWSTVFIALLVTFLHGISLSSILIVPFLLFLGASLTLSAMMISWISEHEADKEAVRGTGLYNFITAIIKVHVYASFWEFLDDVEVKNVEEIKKVVDASIKHHRIILMLLKYSWYFPKWILDLFANPLYQTHPPPQLRLALAIRSTFINP